jgi:magnesium-transporting ATPase (P-type)
MPGDSRLPEAAWHSRTAAEALEMLDSDPRGLSADEAARRLDTCGPNRLAEPPRHGPVRRLLRQFNNVLIYVLLAAAAVAALLGHLVDAAVILGVVLVNSVIGFVQEGRAERALDAIRNMLSLRATVRRDGRRVGIPAESLVPGDVVLLASGDKVPADLRMIEVRSLRIEEAILTGESEPAGKIIDPVSSAAPITDRANIAYSGTLVTYGQGAGVVIATGDATELGRISAMIATVETLSTPLTRKMGIFARWLTIAILVLASVTFAFGVLQRDFTPAEMFMAAVSLAVAAIPEGLPAILTIALAIGVQRMAARNAIIRRLPAVETLGSVTVICSDKTGTLTRNEMMVQHVTTWRATYEIGGHGYAPEGSIRIEGSGETPDAYPDLVQLARAGLLCNDARLHGERHTWRVEGDPTEGALVALAAKAGLDAEGEHEAWPRLDLVPFESEHRYMATLHRDPGGGTVVYVKGAPERILDMCDHLWADGADGLLEQGAWDASVQALARNGERVLGLACRRLPGDETTLHAAHLESGLTLLGLVGIIDPPRPEAIEAVRHCRSAGIRVKMITGDHLVTAQAISRQLGIDDRTPAVAGADIEDLDDAALRDLVRDADVFARSNPEHKLRLVQALQANGEIVAMTGDGVNDAPALKRADVGIAMGIKGTEAAKEAAEMVLADDNFASIVRAVEEGRTVYDNLKKSITFLLPINGGESGALIVAILLGAVLPITPVQILWINMVSSVALALALAFEPTEPDVMRRPPRPPREPILSRFLLWRVGLVSVLFVAGIFGMFEYTLSRGSSLEEARTVAVNTLVAMEVFYLFSVRYLVSPSFTLTGVRGTRAVLIAVGLVTALQALFTWVPFMQHLFGTRPLDARQIIEIVLVGLALLVFLELEKSLLRRLGLTSPRTHAKTVA